MKRLSTAADRVTDKFALAAIFFSSFFVLWSANELACRVVKALFNISYCFCQNISPFLTVVGSLMCSLFVDKSSFLLSDIGCLCVEVD